MKQFFLTFQEVSRGAIGIQPNIHDGAFLRNCLTVFSFILDVRLGSKYASGLSNFLAKCSAY